MFNSKQTSSISFMVNYEPITNRSDTSNFLNNYYANVAIKI